VGGSETCAAAHGLRHEPAKIEPSGKITLLAPSEPVVCNRRLALGHGQDAVAETQALGDPDGFAFRTPALAVGRFRNRTASAQGVLEASRKSARKLDLSAVFWLRLGAKPRRFCRSKRVGKENFASIYLSIILRRNVLHAATFTKTTGTRKPSSSAKAAEMPSARTATRRQVLAVRQA
jgi:hypothetical protein